MLLQWRRGVRGLEYNTLYGMIKEIEEIVRKRESGKVWKRESREGSKCGISPMCFGSPSRNPSSLSHFLTFRLLTIFCCTP